MGRAGIWAAVSLLGFGAAERKGSAEASAALLFVRLVPHRCLGEERRSSELYKQAEGSELKHTFLGLLAKIKCSICSYQFNI